MKGAGNDCKGQRFIEKVRLRIVYGSDDLLEKEISASDISRPGLEMTGYFDYTPERIQLIGMKEWSYLIDDIQPSSSPSKNVSARNASWCT